MNTENQNKLARKYPSLFVKNNPAQHPFDIYGVEHWDGWYEILDELCTKIQKNLNSDKSSFFKFIQIKSKFALFRCYFESDRLNSDYYYGLIDEAQSKSMNICEKCGVKDGVKRNDTGYIFTLCDDCRKQKHE